MPKSRQAKTNEIGKALSRINFHKLDLVKFIEFSFAAIVSKACELKVTNLVNNGNDCFQLLKITNAWGLRAAAKQKLKKIEMEANNKFKSINIIFFQ